MNGFTKQHKQQTASASPSWKLVACAMLLLTANHATAQQSGNENTNVFSGLPTPAEIASTKIDEAVKQIVKQLDSQSFAQRELATQRLISNNIDRRQTCKLLSNNDLSLEQRHRLVNYLQYDLRTTPHAAIGVRINLRRARANEEVIVEALIENLPAIEVLEPGDQVISLDGIPVNNFDQFRQLISSRKPGDNVAVRVKRSFRQDEIDDDQEPDIRELDFMIILGSDDYLLDSDGIKQVNIYVQRAISKDLITVAQRYGPKVLQIESVLESKSDFGTSAAKEK